MTDFAVAIRDDYASALGSYLAERGEAELLRAAGLGRRALAEGLGVLDMAAIHHEGLAAVVRACPPAEASARVEACNVFFSEALSPFEMTHRGFKEVSATITMVLQFAAVVCHELRTPLTSLMNSVGMLAELLEVRPATPEGRLMANINTSMDILKLRTDDLLDLVGFQSGTLTLRPVPVDIASLLAGIAERAGKGKPGLPVHLSIEGTLPPAVLDPVRLEQVVGNLVQNAMKYGAEGGKIDLRARARGDTLVIEVQDYGAGVSLWDRMRIWQPNYRGSARSREVPGLGIGLALCKELVQQHHGEITLESEEGKGSLFRVELPLRGTAGKESERR